MREYKARKRKLPLGFGERLASVIYAKDLTFLQIERYTGISHTNIGDYIQENMIPSAYTLYALCTYLNISADWLLGLRKENEK